MNYETEHYFIINVNPSSHPYIYICRMNTVFLLLGSNLGDKRMNLIRAEKGISDKIGKASSISSVYSTDAWGNEKQDHFLNQALSVNTLLSAGEVLKNILWIEKEMGRIRQNKWEARIIDIDILFFNSEIIKTSELIIPHPHLHERRFVLAPLAEIEGEFLHPVLNKTVKRLLLECPDRLKVALHYH